MPKLDEICGWVMIAGAACYASSSLARLVSARRCRPSLHAIPVQVWYDLFLSLTFLAGGVSALHGFRWTWAVWVAGVFGAAYLIARPIPGIVSRSKARLPWWRFWTRVTPSPHQAGIPSLGPATELGAEAVALIQRIKNATFSTTRLSPGYDEQEVDIFLHKLITVLSENGRLDPGLVRNAHFSTTRIRPGYAIQDVGDFLDDIERVI